jgi:hypothetical protein
MNSVVAAFPNDALHVIVDNLNIHKGTSNNTRNLAF